MDLVPYLQEGVVIVGLAIVLTLLKDQFIDVGDNYVSVLNIFQNKPKAVTAVLFGILGTAIASGYFKEWMLDYVQQPGMLQIGLGLVVLISYHYVHYLVDSWNPNDGTAFMYGVHIVGVVLILMGASEAGFV